MIISPIISPIIRPIINSIISLQPETIAQIIRIEADGGEVIDIAWMDSVIRTLKSQGIYGDTKFVGDANMGVKKDGYGLGAVATLYDISGTNNDATQSVGASQPIWTANQQNGRAGLVYDGVDDDLAADSVSLQNLFLNDTTVISIFKNTQTTFPRWGSVIGTESASSVGWQFRIFIDNATQAFLRLNGYFSNTDMVYDSVTGAVVVDVAYIATGRYTAASRTSELFLNNSEVSYSTQTAGSGTFEDDSTGDTYIGSLGGTTQYFKGDKMGSMIFDSAITTDQRQAMENLFKNYYAIQGI